MINLCEYLAGNEYPGRGIAIGRTPCGKNIRVAYWIMGRSENSRNRVFVEDGEGIRTQAFDPSKLEDPSLIIYAPVRVIDGKTIEQMVIRQTLYMTSLRKERQVKKHCAQESLNRMDRTGHQESLLSSRVKVYR